jgi:glyoxylase-like metal-dependent hydrolase (beta-lactamase superfamily II)
MSRSLIVPLLLLSLWSAAQAARFELEVQPVTDGVWALVGELAQRSPDNLANNATFGVIDTSDGLVLVDPGGSAKGAAQIDAAIDTVSDKPVVLVINTGGQDHRWLGNAYWQDQGARIVASSAAVADQRARQRDQLLALDNLVGKAGMAGTEPVHASETFDERLTLTVGDTELRLYHWGAAHTPGDAVVWLPAQQVLFSGDIIYTERMLGVGSQSDIKSWIEVYGHATALPARHLVPGHGHATDLGRADQDTGRYLRALRDRVAAFIQDGGSLAEISRVDQADFMYLEAADQLAGRNAHQVFQQLEFDF